ncbi:MAG: leucyl aminopeptidase family protein [Bdellovibrionales bacterium]|nr:leucyl aminopeptidase family protein [Bdellovibrionales bacterium]
MSNELLQGPLKSFLDQTKWGVAASSVKSSSKATPSATAEIFYFGCKEKYDAKKVTPPLVQRSTSPAQPLIDKYATSTGMVWVISAQQVKHLTHSGQFDISAYAMARDTMGGVFREAQSIENIELTYIGSDEMEFKGLIVGMEIARYRFRECWPKLSQKNKSLTIDAPKLKTAKKIFDGALTLGKSVNIARHLVNLPGNILNPATYTQTVQELFRGSSMKVDIWNKDRLKKENMNLHLAVGNGSNVPPMLVKMSYRGNSSKKSVVAFVGKGITFDSGGLDIKPSSGMRDMKKDMGGSASVIGVAYWMMATKQKINADFYLPLAENSVSSTSFRPGDIYVARNGKTVEIHNTDAEGRLVLADTLTVASETKPDWIIDVATLTGAIKVGLGDGLPGLFANNDKIAGQILMKAQASGDNCWRMPLDPGQRSKLKSEVADYINAVDGFGGAVTAALFLEAFVDGTPWAHLDIYAWASSASGAFSEKGGSGQMVQTLCHFCEIN